MRAVPVSPSDQHADMLVAILERLGRLERGVSGIRPGRVPSVRARHAGAQTVSASTPTAVTWGGADTYDTDGYHDPAVNSSRLTVPPGLGGLYVVAYSILAAAGTGTASAWLLVNGTGSSWAPDHGATGERLTAADAIPLAAGDYIELVVQHTHSTTLGIGDANDYLTMTRNGGWL